MILSIVSEAETLWGRVIVWSDGQATVHRPGVDLWFPVRLARELCR